MSIIIPFHPFGGSGSLIHFAHGNGYTPGCYDPLLAHLTTDTRAIGMKNRALWGGSEIEKMDGWRLLADDLTDFLNTRNLRQIIGMGHSLGAVTSAFAAHNNADFFKALVLIEPALFMPTQLAMFRMMPQAMLKSQPLFSDALNRPTHWESLEEVNAYVNSEDKYGNWTAEAKQSYIEHGFRQTSAGIELTFSSDWETLIYRQAPRAWNLFKNIDVPTLAIRGVNSDVMTDKAWDRWKKTQPEATFVEIPDAGHWVTMEKPAEVAGHILQFLQTHNLLDR